MDSYYRKAGEHVRQTPIAMRYYIFFEVQNAVPIFFSYKNMCLKYGSDAMSYQEFEFWYWRVYQGNFDMTYDNSNDPKPKELVKLPLEIVDKIAKNLNEMERQVIRKVSKFFREYVDYRDPGFKYVSIETNDIATAVWLDKWRVFYRHAPIADNNGYQYSATTVQCSMRDNYYSLVRYSNHFELALHDLSLILKNPKLRLEKFYFSSNTWHDIENEMTAKIRSLGNQIHTKVVEVVTYHSQGEMSILPFLNPEYLKDVHLNFMEAAMEQNRTITYAERLGRIGDLEQCRQAGGVHFKLHSNHAETFPMERFFECNFLSLEFSYGYHLNLFSVNRLRKAFMKTTRMKTFRFYGKTEFQLNALKKRLGKGAIEDPYRPEVRFFKIPRSDNYFELIFFPLYNYSVGFTMSLITSD